MDKVADITPGLGTHSICFMKIKMNSPSSGENLFKKRHVKSIFLLYVFMVKFKLFRDDIGVMYMMCSRI